MAIGASIGARIKHLKERKGMHDTDLAKVLHIDRATLKRIINGDTEKVSSQVIINAAHHFGVSTDFLLGLTDMPDPMNHPVESFGLTEGAARAILSENVNIGISFMHGFHQSNILLRKSFEMLPVSFFRAFWHVCGQSEGQPL